jgi:hypothetical protein
MKTFIAFCFVGLAILAACRPEQPEIITKLPTTDTIRPSVVAQDTFAIGDGVEIYRALLDWQNGPRLTRYFSTGIILGEKPIFRYNDIKKYYKFFRDGDTWQIAFETNRKIFDGFSQNSLILGTPFLYPQWASDTGFVVTLNKVPIYFAYYRNRNFPSNKEQNLAFVRAQDRDRYNQPLENILPVIWDSSYSNTEKAPRPEPDPRFDKRLLERLKKDGKLGF